MSLFRIFAFVDKKGTATKNDETCSENETNYKNCGGGFHVFFLTLQSKYFMEYSNPINRITSLWQCSHGMR